MNGALYIGQRLGKGVVVVLAIIIVNFLLIRMAPGDPAVVMAGESGASDEVYVAQLRKAFGLDRPIPEQLGIYVSNIARLDLGYSHRMQRPVLDMIVERLPATLLLTVTAYLLSLLAGITLVAVAAARAGRLSDTLITVFSLVFYATPIFWVGLMGILLFTVTLGWLPAFGMASVSAGMIRCRATSSPTASPPCPAVTLAMPKAGSQPSVTVNRRIPMSPTQKIGVA